MLIQQSNIFSTLQNDLFTCLIQANAFCLSFADEKDLSYPAEYDPFLMTFLRPAKFYTKGAFERLQKYFKFKLKYKKYCEDLTVESARIVFEDQLVKYLPLRDVEGRRILYLSCGSKLIKFEKNYRTLNEQVIHGFFNFI